MSGTYVNTSNNGTCEVYREGRDYVFVNENGTPARFRFVGRGQLQHNGTPGPTAFGRPDLDAFFDRNDGVAGVTFDDQLTPRMRQRASYAFTVSHQQSTNLIADPSYTPRFENRAAPFAFSDFRYNSFNDLRRHHLSYQADVRLANDASHGDQLLTVVADWDGERATLEDRLASTQVPASRNNTGVAVQHQAIWRRVVVTAGARVEHNESFGTAAVPRGSIVLVVHEAGTARDAALGETRVHVSGGLGIKEPTVLQSFSPSPFFRGNPDLLPERSRSVEAGVEQRFAGDRARVELRRATTAARVGRGASWRSRGRQISGFGGRGARRPGLAHLARHCSAAHEIRRRSRRSISTSA